ncbi:hypothetical protein VC83_06459 [Pseudogymnoascus destructans]|uniref:DUF155 domain-containing protein n=2 Tax=Pseudogymnoascus destructans TaxID=655981 RepID=L8FRF4_PSED2|nr:uncharacterized protein VC83_06459 [Pseudogymnoascus destructans]ELR02291.1 hypothetical protein GMDG_05360 [Pseudogymnoascus destructans 20631-21]OAF58383.1 hypothetical protein VC83_06459 [Pseudogymnoascus destructans]
MSTPPGKRGPSVLVTDSRERLPAARQQARPSGAASTARVRMPTRYISVDNVLQNSSEIPSGQARLPPNTQTARPGVERSMLAANVSPGTRTSQVNIPGRTTKVSEKLVLIPELEEGREIEEGVANGTFRLGYVEESEDEGRPLRNEELDELRRKGALRGKSYAERLPKAKRTEKVARCTAYCTAQGFKMAATAAFVKGQHGAKTKLYDDCLYTVYHLPLLPGNEGYRLRSSPILKHPGGKAVLDEEIERSEARVYHEGYFEDTDVYGVRGGEESPAGESDDDRIRREDKERRGREEERVAAQGKRGDSPNRLAPDATTFAEMFVFSYGVVVFWNFTESQEKDTLADFTFTEMETGQSIIWRPQDEADFETEELHFEYSSFVDRPRVFNDMITLRSGDHMIKLAMSHAIAQSTKLSFFEEKMSQTMLDAQHVPKRLALTGELGMSRPEVVKILGRLFKSRVDVNLSSNILDVPNFFWDSEPTLHPLYFAVREYLEITPRIKVLNERCRVFLELAEILTDSISDTKMSNITWIIIWLIAVSIVVTVSEVVLRFGMLQSGRNTNMPGVCGLARVGAYGGGNNNLTRIREKLTEDDMQQLCGMPYIQTTYNEL